MKGLPYEVKTLLTKARESALLAVETYNRPSATFRSGAYIVLMIISWTSLFHAIFVRKGTKPYYRRKNSRRYDKYDPFKPEEMKEYEKVVAMIKTKDVPVENLGLLKPSEVVNRVAKAIGRPFNQHHHTVCYRHFNARPANDYGYTDDWVHHLVSTLSDAATYDFLFTKKAAGSQLRLANGGSAA